jgi:hypothetical protein
LKSDVARGRQARELETKLRLRAFCGDQACGSPGGRDYASRKRRNSGLGRF